MARIRFPIEVAHATDKLPSRFEVWLRGWRYLVVASRTETTKSCHDPVCAVHADRGRCKTTATSSSWAIMRGAEWSNDAAHRAILLIGNIVARSLIDRRAILAVCRRRRRPWRYRPMTPLAADATTHSQFRSQEN